MSFKESWQNFLTKIDNRIPIKKITSPLDKKFPLTSFFLFLLIILIILYFVFGSSLISSKQNLSEVTIKLADSNGNILDNFDFKIRNLSDGTTNSYTTNQNGTFKISLDRKKLYFLVVDNVGYQFFEQEIKFTTSSLNFIIPLLIVPETFSKVIFFEDALTNQKITDNLNVIITCENGQVINPSSTNTSNGRLLLDIPSTCDKIYAKVIGDKYNEDRKEIKITDSSVLLNPKTYTKDTGSVSVSVLSGDLFIEDSITLKIFSIDDSVSPIKTIQTNLGVGFFSSIDVGEYIVKASDVSNRYLQSQKEVIITKNNTSEITIFMADTSSSNILNPDTNQPIEIKKINVFVKDKETQETIDENFSPKVTLLLDGNQNVDSKEFSQGFTFNIDTSKNYSLKATAEGYIPSTIVSVSNTQENYILSLEKITLSNVSNLNVSVIDEDLKPINGIRAWIYDKEGQYIDPRFDSVTTDENGFVIFKNIPDLNFTIKVKNDFIEEISSPHKNTPPQDTNISLPVIIGKGTVSLTVKNKLQDAVSDAQVTFYSESLEVLGTSLVSSNGTLQNSIKADKRVFLKVEANGYLPYFTEMFRIYKNKTTIKEITLERPLTGNEMSIEYLGLFNTDNQQVQALKNNQVFYLKYKVIMPSSVNSYNFTFRAGSLEDVKDDIVFIMPENTSLGVGVYYDKEPFTESGNYLESKLVNIQVLGYPSSVQEITIPIRIKNAKTNDKISLFYSSTVNPINNYMTHNYTQLQYFVEATSLCGDTFCFSGQYVDVLEGLRYDIGNNRQVPMLVNSDYSIEYTITNSSSNNYPSFRFSAINLKTDNSPATMVNIKNYIISGEISSQGATASGETNFKIPFMQAEVLKDSLNAFSKIDFNLNVVPLIVGQSKLQHRFISSQTEILSLPINFVVSNFETMEISYTPTNIVPGVPFILDVTVKDSKGNYLEGVNINLLQKTTNGYSVVLTDKVTNSQGKVSLSLPSLRPGETFVIEAIKSKYFAQPLEFTIKKDVLDVLHEVKVLTSNTPLEAFIHKTNIDGELYTLKLKNKTEYPITLKQFNNQDVSFNKSHLLNLGQTINYLNNQITSQSSGFIIPAGEEKELVIKFAPSESARTHPVSEDILGVITGNYILNNFESTFPIPVKAKLSVGSGVLQDDCLVVTQGGDWTTIVSTNNQTTTLRIRNTCLSKEGKTPIALKNVQAKITSQGDRQGIYFLKLIGSSSSNQIQLSENFNRIVVTEMKPDEEYEVQVMFSPNGTRFAEVKTNIHINAQVETQEGLVFVNKGNNDVVLKTKISIMNLSECVGYVDNEGKNINSGGLYVLNGIEENTLTINNKCSGKATFKMDLCEGNDFGCRDLSITNTDEERNILNFNLNDSQKTVTIKRDSTKAPGAYILNNKVSVVNNFGREVTSSFVSLKINAKDPNGLWMEDPFIEISENKESEIVRLYNNNIDKTPWDFVEKIPTAQENNNFKQQTSSTSLFSNYLSSEFNKNDSAFKKMNYKYLQDFTFATVVDESAWMPVSGAIVISATAAAMAYGGIIGSISLFGSTTPALLLGLAAIPVWGWVTLATVVLVSWAATSWKNEFVYPVIENKYLDIEKKYTLPNGEAIKVITTQDLSDEKLYLNIFDITGSRYYQYNNLIVKTKDADQEYRKINDRLTKNATLSLSEYSLCTSPNYELGFYDSQLIKNRNCSGTFSPVISEDGKLSHSIECYGSKPTRNRIQLKTSLSYVCKANEVIWPEQAGIKPLQFVFKDDIYAEILNDSKKYYFKNYDLHPTLDDSLIVQDPSFINSENIGQFRFGFSITKPKETPNYDLNLQDCVTDTGRLGKTGEGAVPNISLDWEWNLSDISKCSNTYCDATQLSQVVLNRINEAEKLISSKSVQCPISTEQLVGQSMVGNYYIKNAEPSSLNNEVLVGKVGLDSVSLETSENKLIVKVNIDNRTGSYSGLTNNLVLSLDNKLPSKAFFRNEDGDLEEITTNLSSLQIIYNNKPTDSEDTLTTYVFEFGATNNPILGENLELNINLSGTSIDSLNNSFSSILNLSIFENQTTQECLVPATTVKYNGISYLDMWFNKQMYPDNVTGSGWSQSDITKLKELLEFDVYLITDKYNKNFINDFDIAYGGLASKEDGSGTGSQALMSSPTLFSNGYLSKIYKNNLIFNKEYSSEQNNVDITVPGKYKVRIDFSFNNSSWRFENQGKIDANTYVTFRYLSSPETDSIFYRIPFNGFVGKTNSGYNRQGYGVSYSGDIIRIDNKYAITDSDNGSNALRNITITKSSDIGKINSNIESRGNILKLTYNQPNINMEFTPSYPTPVLMSITKNNTSRPLEVFYRLKDKSDNSVDTSSLLRWTGVGSGIDFSGQSIYNNVYYDRSATSVMNNAYILDWPQVVRTGKVYLRTVFYVPEKETFTLENRTSQETIVRFSTNGTSYSSSVTLGSQNPEINVSSISDILSLVKENKVCVVNSYDGTSSEFFYNPAEIFSEKFITAPLDALK